LVSRCDSHATMASGGVRPATEGWRIAKIGVAAVLFERWFALDPSVRGPRDYWLERFSLLRRTARLRVFLALYSKPRIIVRLRAWNTNQTTSIARAYGAKRRGAGLAGSSLHFASRRRYSNAIGAADSVRFFSAGWRAHEKAFSNRSRRGEASHH